MNALQELKGIIDLEEIKKIALNDIELDIETTLELMKDAKIKELLEDLEFWCDDFKIVITYTQFDFYDEYYFAKVSLKPDISIKVVPESLKKTWTDPETGKELPMRSKAYLEKERQDELALEKAKEQRIKAVEEKINKKAQEVDVYDFKPFTVIKGGLYNDCRYITLPENWDIPTSDLIVTSQEFYSNMDMSKVGSINFVGLAASVNGKNEVIFACNGKTFDKAPHVKEKIERLIKDKKFTPVVGFSPESMRTSDTEEEIERIVNEFKKHL